MTYWIGLSVGRVFMLGTFICIPIHLYPATLRTERFPPSFYEGFDIFWLEAEHAPDLDRAEPGLPSPLGVRNRPSGKPQEGSGLILIQEPVEDHVQDTISLKGI